MTIEMVVFGLDSVLFDTEAAHFHSCNHAFEKCGLSHQWSLEQYRQAAIAFGAVNATDALAGKLGASIEKSDISALSQEKNRFFHELACNGDIALHPGCASLIEEALGDGCKLAIVTGLSAPTATVLLEQAFSDRLTDMFAAIASGVRFDSPSDNSAYHLVLRTVGADPWRSIAIASSSPALLTAKKAGLWTVATTPAIDTADSIAGADSWYPDLRLSQQPSRFISLDILESLKSASRLNPAAVAPASSIWA